MATEVLLVKELNRLAPYESLSDDVLRGSPQGEIVKAVLTRPRNVKHHRKFFALLKVVYESQSKYATMGHVLTWFKKAAGLGESMIIDGKEILSPAVFHSPRWISLPSNSFTTVRLTYSSMACCPK